MKISSFALKGVTGLLSVEKEDDKEKQRTCDSCFASLSPQVDNKTSSSLKSRRFSSQSIQDIDISMLSNILNDSSVAATIGKRWFETSGAKELMENSPTTYEMYTTPLLELENIPLSPNLQIYEADIMAIKKDISSGRSDAEAFSDIDLIRLLSDNDYKDTKASELEVEDVKVEDIDVIPEKILAIRNKMTRILVAFAKKNRPNGYTQGINYLTRLLLAFMPEEHIFWTLCVVVERLRLPDFYSPHPSPMHGFLIG
jgi:hypothetical protein